MGFLTNNFISDFFAMILTWMNSFIGSYGWSIVLLTILLRLALLPIDIKQKKGMRLQKKYQPEIEKINKKYANDKEMQSRKTMEFYKQVGYSPLSGCLPMILQMVILFAFFGAMRTIAGQQILAIYEAAKTLPPESINIESWLWVKNIWQPDVFQLMANFPKNTTVVPLFEYLQGYTEIKDYALAAALQMSGTEMEAKAALEYFGQHFDSIIAPLSSIYEGLMNGWFVLPLLAGGMSFLQSKLTMPATPAPTAGDTPNPMSGKLMQYMFPILSLVICVSSSAAFALYWSVSSIVGVLTSILVEKILNAKENAEKLNA